MNISQIERQIERGLFGKQLIWKVFNLTWSKRCLSLHKFIGSQDMYVTFKYCDLKCQIMMKIVNIIKYASQTVFLKSIP